ncbi:phage baseplate protein [Aliarcobacter lanthieri]|uniref:phage baseplate protein n=1 Tax=Aliarcobacter lanthieri TaxID=1355374 RepID=UPI003AA80B0E
MMIKFFDNDTKEEIFKSTNILTLDVKLNKQATKYQVEDGTERNNHIIEKVKEIDAAIVLSKVDESENIASFLELLDYFNNDKLVTVQTKMNIYNNMLIEAIPHNENKDIFYGCAISMHLTEWREVKPEYGELKQEQVKDKKHSDTQKTGRQQGSEVTNPQERTTVIKKTANYFRGTK